MKKVGASLVLFVLLTACGGGGGDAGTSPYGPGSGGGGATPGGDDPSGVPTLSIALLNASSQPVFSTQGNTSYTVAVTLTNSAGTAAVNSPVTVTATDFTLSPTNGRVLTHATTGVARVSAQQTDASANSATQICASATVEATQLVGCVDVQMGAVAAQLGTLTTASPATPVGAYQSVQLSILATQVGGASPAVGVPISFTASCGTVSPSTVNTDVTGLAQVAYTNSTGTTACSGTQTITAATDTVSRSLTLTTEAPTPANIQFVPGAVSRIYLKGSPGISSTSVKFKLVDQNGNPMTGRNMEVSFVLQPAGTLLQGAITSPVVVPTDANGEVSVTVQSGTAPGPLQLRAQLSDDADIFNVSNGLSVASGLPTQSRFSLSVTTFNIEGLEYDGTETTLTVRAADRLGNPVPDGTTINFISAGGQIVSSCSTASGGGVNTAGCSVVLASQIPRLTGRIAVLAWAQGEETFVDLSSPSNNVFDGADTHTDQGQPYLDVNLNGNFNPGDGDISVGASSGTAACPVTAPGTSYNSIPNTCSGSWGAATVSRFTTIIFSGSTPDTDSADLGVVRTELPAGGCSYSFTLQDANGNPMPADTTLAVTGPTGLTFSSFGGQGPKVPNTNQTGGTFHTANFTACGAAGTVGFTLTVSTPKGIVTNISMPPAP